MAVGSGTLFGSKPGETPGGEAPPDKGDPEEDKDKAKGEKKDGLFRRIFGHKPDKKEEKRGGGN